MDLLQSLHLNIQVECQTISVIQKWKLTGRQLLTFYFLFFHCRLVGRVGEVDDIAQAVAYLAGDSGAFLTGVLLPLDGGYFLSPSH